MNALITATITWCLYSLLEATFTWLCDSTEHISVYSARGQMDCIHHLDLWPFILIM